MATSPYSTGPEGAAALIAQAESEGVRLSVAPGGGLRHPVARRAIRPDRGFSREDPARSG